MNPSPLGGFAEGLAGGISGGINNYVQLMIKKIDMEQQKTLAQSETDQKIFSDKAMPLSLRKAAWKRWAGANTDWNTGVKVPNDLPDYVWEDKRFDEYQQKLLKIRNNPDYSFAQKTEAAQALVEEATNILGAGQAAGLKGEAAGMKREAFVAGIGELGTKMSPETVGSLFAAGDLGKKMIEHHGKPVKPEKETEHYFRLGNNYYEIKGGVSKRVQKGSPKEQAWMNTMREPMYSYWSPAQQFQCYKKHLAFLQGTPQLAPTEMVDKEAAVEDKPGFASEVFNRFFPKQVEKYSDGRKPLMKPQTIIRPVAPGTKLTKEMAKKIWEASGHNAEKAREIAKSKGYIVLPLK